MHFYTTFKAPSTPPGGRPSPPFTMRDINTILTIIINLEKVLALLLTIGGLYVALFRVLDRLGTGLQSRKISIIADAAEYTLLKKDLKDTGIFREDNVHRLKPETLDTPEKAAAELSDESLLIFIYTAPEQDELLKRVLAGKQTKAGLIVYARSKLSEELFAEIGETSNAVIVNAKGRLLNDLLNLMMTTSLQRTDPLSRLLGR